MKSAYARKFFFLNFLVIERNIEGEPTAGKPSLEGKGNKS